MLDRTSKNRFFLKSVGAIALAFSALILPACDLGREEVYEEREGLGEEREGLGEEDD